MDSQRIPNPNEQLQSEDTPIATFTSPVSKNIVSECMNLWIHYLQMLNGLCSSGLKLSQSLNILAQSIGSPMGVAIQCQASWDELSKATIVATHTVKTHITAAMQDMGLSETHSETESQLQMENNQQIISESLLTFINLQYQFSIATCECLGAMATCPFCQTVSGGVHDPECSMASLQQCFTRLYSQDQRSQTSSPHSTHTYVDKMSLDSPKSNQQFDRASYQHTEGPRVHSPITSSTEPRIPSPFQGHESLRGPSPVQGFLDTIRSIGHIETAHGPLPNPGQLQTMKMPFPGRRGSRSPLNFPLFPLNSQRRWSEAAAAEMGGESNDGTMRRWSMPWDSGKTEQHAWSTRLMPMSKLAVPTSGSSQDRSRSTTPEVSTCITAITGSDGLADAIQLLSTRPFRSTSSHSHSNQPIEEKLSRKLYHTHGHRSTTSGQDLPPTTSIMTEHFDICHPGFPLTSRKSSSSTDSSSCLSIHSRSTNSSDRCSESGAGDALRTHSHIYSIWSGNDYLPFIRVPESKEPQDDSDTDEPSTDCSNQSLFPKPS